MRRDTTSVHGTRTPWSPDQDRFRFPWTKASLLLGLWWLVLGAVAADQNLSPFYLSQLRLAWQCYTNADYSNSVAHYQAAIKAAPQSLEARLGCLLPFLALERFADAESLAGQVLKQHPANYHASLRLAFALRMQNRLEQAEEVLQRALALHPTDVSCLLELALVKLARKQDATARRLFADVLTLSPGNAIALDQLASSRLLHEPQDAPLPRPWAFTPGLRPPPGARQVHVATAAYYAYLDYHHTAAKDHAHAAGLYASLGYGPEHRLEAEADYLHKFYRGYPSLQQWDTTLAYANFSIPRVKLRLGGHFVASEDPFTDQGWVVFGGAEYYAGSRWAAGLGGYFTKYPEFQKPLEVVQLAPHLGLTLWHGANTTWLNDLRGYWIHLNQDTFGQRDCFS
ncbi:MAG: tetratricopeptide repeat protein, partial [Verrucomicrobia bacterium]|nr:tetratricopeptide repeat protein [Verrucomicrobiota bacterium]